MKRLALLALISTTAYAQTVNIIGYIPNRDNNRITFTNYKGNCPDGNKVVYTQHDGGKIGAVGCFQMIDDQLFVIWNDGDIYTYSIDAFVVSDEFRKYMEKNR